MAKCITQNGLDGHGPSGSGLRPTVSGEENGQNPCPACGSDGGYCISEMPTAWVRFTIATGSDRAVGSLRVPP